MTDEDDKDVHVLYVSNAILPGRSDGRMCGCFVMRPYAMIFGEKLQSMCPGDSRAFFLPVNTLYGRMTEKDERKQS